MHTSCVESLPTSSIPHLFGSCLRGFQKDLKPIIILGAAATCWSIWLCRNDLVFEKKLVYSPLQVVFSVIHWLRTCVILQKPFARALVLKASQQLMQVATMFFFRAHGWRSSLRIDKPLECQAFFSLALCLGRSRK